MPVIALGLDFGTESVRAILVDSDGREVGSAVHAFEHGQILDALPGSTESLPERFALQCPADWIESAAIATKQALAAAGLNGDEIVGIGVDFTSCTMLPAKHDGTPLCELDSLKSRPLAWPKLWKHHGALDQADRMTAIAKERDESFLKRYGGVIGLEWFFPKMLETIEQDPEVAEAAEVWLEAGDWLVWQLVGGDSKSLVRSTCQAGYKAMWSADEGYPSQDYFDAVHPKLAEAVAHRMPGEMLSPGQVAGQLTDAMATQFGLPTGVPVSAAIIDAHAGVPGVGAAEPGTLVMVLGTSSCHMLNATKMVEMPGVAGVVEGGILPGLFGYETGQAAVGDAFAWLLKLLNRESFDDLAKDAMSLPPGAEGVACLDWLNGCRTPLMDGSVRGAFTGLGMQHGPAHLYLALMEASAFGVRWIVEMLRHGSADQSSSSSVDAGVPIDRIIATGGLPHHNRAFVEVYADVLGMPIEIHPSTQGPAVGAAVLGMVAAGPEKTPFASIAEAASAMAAVPEDQCDLILHRSERTQAYEPLYDRYRQLADAVAQQRI
ncbi:ribulokinase [Rhodopirellula bahusiensis]|uniref:Ribulokinase n=1 Tax=Rhodopirellula bahusiensis TaxID=2014065 RepID=A0A2G1WDK5_9BACT|nr:ribulokinase [Rhodopirellula bahusiensis]PHQ37101.1 ribulokinase [Rhodopirellula bahusiensis]